MSKSIENGKKKICLIYTGGTIGMNKTEFGYAPVPGYMEESLLNLSELHMDSMPDYDFIEYEPLMDSSNITVSDWNRMARDIHDRYDLYSGFVIMHGTDTMAYTASALSFMLRNLNKPVILTGSQIPFCEVRSDARQNLITAVIIAASHNVPEVCTYFGGKLMRGNRSSKISSDMLIAFDSPNCEPLAEAGVDIVLNNNILKVENEQLSFCEFEDFQIAVLKIFPGIQFEIFENIMTHKLKGIVIEAFGAGNIPQNDDSMVRILKKASEMGTHIVVCTQCLKGSAELGQYETSKELVAAGAICGFDMTVEAAVTKLYYLLSKGYEGHEIKNLMEKSICGELTIKEGLPIY